MIENRMVTPEYRKAMGTPLLRGRDFEMRDLKSPVVIINARFAEKYFARRNPIGGQLKLVIVNLSIISWSTVIGVVGNVHHNSLEEAGRPQVFQPVDNGNKFAISFTIPKQQLLNEIRAALHSLDRALTLENVRTMRERIQESNTRRNFETALFLGFAVIAIALAIAGLYGLMSYTVKRRTAEIGIRLAIGSSRRHVLVLILSEGMQAVLGGLFAGLMGAFFVTRLISGWLFGVKPVDPITFIAVTVFVLLVACGACLVPAWRATRIDPMEALRRE
jgi:putative ABC transport system permease protein